MTGPAKRRTVRVVTAALLAMVPTVVLPGGSSMAENTTPPAVAVPGQACEGLARSLTARATDVEKVGQLFVPWVAQSTADGPTELERRRIQERGYGAFNFNGGTLHGPEHAARYTNQLQEWAADTRLGIPVLPTMDMEIGAAHRFSVMGPGRGMATPLPYPMGLGATRDTTAAATSARITAREARAVGFAMNIAPVADVNTNPENPVIGVRSFSEDTGLVSEMIAAQVEAYQANGVIAMPKHFPGHGDTSLDSHTHLPTVSYDRETLERVHLAPFKAAIDAGADSIMTAHVVVEAVDPELPATLSEKVLTGLLREEMGFDGLIVTDSMSMAAIRERWGMGGAAVMAFQAGADMIMASDDESYDAILAAVRSGEITRERLDRSVRRVIELKCEYGLFRDRYVDPARAAATFGTPENLEAAERISRESVTLVANDGTLPLPTGSSQRIVVTGVTHGGTADQLPNLVTEVRARTGAAVDDHGWRFDSRPSDAKIDEVVRAAESADVVIVGTFSKATPPAQQVELVKALAAIDTPVVVLSLGLPYELTDYGDVNGAVATYAVDLWGSPSRSAVLAGLDVLFGAQPGGKLPVTLGEHYPFGHGLTY